MKYIVQLNKNNSLIKPKIENMLHICAYSKNMYMLVGVYQWSLKKIWLF